MGTFEVRHILLVILVMTCIYIVVLLGGSKYFLHPFEAFSVL